MKKQKLKKMAQKIIDLEKECQQGKNVQENMAEIYNIISALSFEDLLQLDDYLWSKLANIEKQMQKNN